VEVVKQRCAGIDVSKRDGKVCVRVQGRGSMKTSSRVTTWSASMPSILQLREKLVADRVELVVLESTSWLLAPVLLCVVGTAGRGVGEGIRRPGDAGPQERCFRRGVVG